MMAQVRDKKAIIRFGSFTNQMIAFYITLLIFCYTLLLYYTIFIAICFPFAMAYRVSSIIDVAIDEISSLRAVTASTLAEISAMKLLIS